MFVLGIAGPSGSGKTTLVRNIVKQLDDCIFLHYDDYKPNYDKLTEDLEELRKGNSISYPKTGQQIVPTKYIIIEEPTGRSRKGMDDKIDYLVYINLPLEVSFTRVLLRSLEQSTDESINAFYETIGPQFEPKSSEKPTKLMHIMYWQLKMYLQAHRQLYLKDHQTHLEDADLIIDGMKSSEELAEEILVEFQNFIEKK